MVSVKRAELGNLVRVMVDEGDDAYDIIAVVKEAIIIKQNRINVEAQRDRERDLADPGALDAQADRSEQ